MKIHVVKNSEGRIIASYEYRPTHVTQLQPQLPKGHVVEKIEVPDDYAFNLETVYKKPTER
jgi:hypothetical protein